MSAYDYQLGRREVETAIADTFEQEFPMVTGRSVGEVRPGLAARITAVAPMTSKRRKSSSPVRLILPSFCRPAVEFSRGVMPIQEAKCRPERKARGSVTLRAKLTAQRSSARAPALGS